MSIRKRGESSVIGTLLLVAVTVIAASVLSVFVLQLGESTQQPAPQAEFTADTCSDCASLADPGSGTTNFLNITFTQGDTLEAENVLVYLDGNVLFDPSKTGAAAYNQPANYDGAGPNDLRWSSDQITAGERLILEDDADADSGKDIFQDGQVVKVVWTNPESDESYVLIEQRLRY